MPISPLFLTFDNSYARLPEAFYRRLDPVPVAAPKLFAFNQGLAAELGIGESKPLADIFSGNLVPQGAEPIAMAYAGHQFGHFVPQLGDGRAILLGEVIDKNGMRRDIQLKGSGQTPFSRKGDGRAALGPVIREYLVSEAMHALGISTTRALAAVATGEPVMRETMLPGAVLTRVAQSHIRIGTFQYMAAHEGAEALRALGDYTIARLYPQARDAENPYLALLQNVVDAQAKLVASWMHVGFIHGVMNTDNMALSGETLDYGPCAFMEHFEPLMVFSSIDRQGRYAFASQPRIAAWNLTRLAETLLFLFSVDMDKAVKLAEATINEFPKRFGHYWLTGMRKKCGLFTEQEGDLVLIEEWLGLLHEHSADYTNSFRLLCYAAEGKITGLEALGGWLARWQARCAQEPQSAGERAAAMRRVNPAYIPRNHRVEEAIVAAVEHDDFSVMEALGKALANPYEEQNTFAHYAAPATAEERVIHTFCGT